MFFQGKKVTVTGSNGLVGQNLVNRLAEAGANVRAVWHKTQPHFEHSNVELVKADLMCPDACQHVVDGADFVVVASAVTFGSKVLTGQPLAFLTPNLIMNSQLMEAGYRAQVKKMLFYSSTTGYPVQDTPVKEEDFFRDDPFWKYMPVGWMKRMTETVCRIYSQCPAVKPNMPCLVIRPSNLVGPYDKFDPNNSHVLPAMIRKVAERQAPIEVWGDGSETRDIIYIDDFIDATMLALEKLNTYEPINVGMGKGYTVKELLNIVCEVDGYKNPELRFDPSKPTTIPFRLVDISKAKSLLGWEPKHDIYETVRKTLHWFKNHYKGI